jgi:hypothetical protein
MRLWSLHPKYLDAQGLVALWREALLAKAVLRNETKGYRNHPQLERFRASSTPLLAINAYLAAVFAESVTRGYSFNRYKVGPVRTSLHLPVTSGQLTYEWSHLLGKLCRRSPVIFADLKSVVSVECHPLFAVRSGPIAHWERQA